MWRDPGGAQRCGRRTSFRFPSMSFSRRHALQVSMVTVATVLVIAPQPGPAESTEVLRAQLELSVCDVRGAGTSSAVWATLSGVRTWLDRPGVTIDRGGRYRFDLLLGGVRTLAEISTLAIGVDGEDSLCLSELRLIINGVTIYVRGSPSRMLLDATTHYAITLDARELRANSAWQHYGWSLAEWIAKTGAAVPREELVARLESCIATVIHDLDISWRARSKEPIRLRRQSNDVVRVSAELTRGVPYWFDRDIELELDLSTCQAGRPEAAIRNVMLRENASWYSSLVNRDQRDADARLVAELRARFAKAQPLAIAGGVCPHVDRDGNLLF